MQMTIRGNLIKTTGITLTPVASIKSIKCHWNSVLHDNSRYYAIDIKNFYLNLQLNEYACMRLPVAIIPTAIMELHNLQELICDKFVCVEVRGEMYEHLEAS